MNSNKASYKYIAYLIAMIVLMIILAGFGLAEPGVSSINVNDDFLTESDVGAGKFVVTIDFNVTMNTSVDAIVTFNPAIDTTLTNCSGVWTDSDTFSYTCDVEDANVEEIDIDIQVSDAQDADGNIMSPDFTTGADKFSVDTIKPFIISATAAPDPAKAGTVTVTVVFSESMSNTTAPTVQVTGLTNLYTVILTSYFETTWMGSFSLNDSDEEATAIISVAGAKDVAGNTMEASVSAGNFEVDTIEPVIGVVSLSPSYYNGSVFFITGITNISTSITENNIDKCEYSLNGGSDWVAGVVNGSYCKANNVDTSSATSIVIRANDTASNIGISDAVVVNVDDEAPETDALCNGEVCTGDWYSVPVQIDLSCDDGFGIGCSAIYYCEDNSNECVPSTEYENSILVSSAGTTYIRFFSTDNLGHEESVQSLSVKIDYDKPTFIFSWWDTLGFDPVNEQSYALRLPDYHDFTIAKDIFYSPSERVIKFAVALNEAGDSGIASVYANLSEFDDFPSKGSCTGVLELELNSTSGLYEGNCTLDAFDAGVIEAYASSLVATFNVYFTAFDDANNEAYTLYNTSDNDASPCQVMSDECLPAMTIINLHDFGVPVTGLEDVRLGGLTTNLSDLSKADDFNNVNFVLDIEVNLSSYLGVEELPRDFKKIILLNFTSLDFSSPSIGQKLARLTDAIEFDLLSPRSFGKSRIYVNTSLFAELDSDARIRINKLPFMQEPYINPDNPGAEVTLESWESNGFDEDFGAITGNLTFAVGGFSGYDIFDNQEPLIEIITPEEEEEINNDEVTINVSVNGTGSEVSNVIISVGGIKYSWAADDFECVQRETELEVVDCSLTAPINSGDIEVIVTGFDYGGEAPGNNASLYRIIHVNDGTAPNILSYSPAQGAEFSSSTTSVQLNVTTDENSVCKYDEEDLEFESMTKSLVGEGTIHTASVSVSAGTSYTYYVRCSDPADNTNNESIVISFSVKKKTSGGGGGGGGGLIPSNPSTSQTWTHVTPGAATIMKISNDDFGIKEIIINVRNPVKNMVIRIEKLPGKPAEVTKNITGKVYRYLKIEKNNLSDSDLQGIIRIRFQVLQSWLQNNNVEARNIVLKRFNNGVWEDLKTTLLSTDSKNAYYESETPSMSYFAIGEKIVESVSVPKLDQGSLPSSGGDVSGKETGKPVEKTPGSEEKNASSTSTKTGSGVVEKVSQRSKTGVRILIILVVLIAIALIILTSFRGRRNELKPIKEIKA